MDEATAKLLSEKAATIAKQTADSLKMFTRETAMLVYAKQMVDSNINTNFAEGTTHKKMDNQQANKKMDKMLEDAKLKWKYADDSSKRKAAQMEKIIMDGQTKIKAIYAVEIEKLTSSI